MHRGGFPVVFDIGRPDQREVALVGNCEHDAAVGVLEDIRKAVCK